MYTVLYHEDAYL